MTTEYIINLALKAFPYLVYCAQLRQTTTYKSVAESIVKHWRVVPHLLGYIRDEICKENNLPLLNAIVVNQNTKMPGESFLPEGTKHLSKEQYLIEFEKLRDEVFQYKHWDDILRKYGLKPIVKSPEDFNKEGEEYTKMIQRRGESGEGKEHKELNEYIFKNPKFLGIDENVNGFLEYPFISGDKCDVVFKKKGSVNVVVEVKKQNEESLSEEFFKLLNIGHC